MAAGVDSPLRFRRAWTPAGLQGGGTLEGGLRILDHWAQDAFFYHIYPLGLCGAPERNDFKAPPAARLEKLYGWLDHLRQLGVNALYLGPLFESGSHGYDTVDYFRVDRRLGDNSTLARLCGELRRRGMRVILDGVFHHVGRQFWAFQDVQGNGERSAYQEWFAGMRFDQESPLGDPFSYEAWEGHFELPKLNLANPEVAAHLLQAVGFWIERFDIDGLRLDVAYLLDPGFLGRLSHFCRERKPGFWLLGEAIHGDYRRWVAPGLLDSATNYECYKGLYSSHNDRNYFEIAYSLNRQFGEGGIYRDLPLYSFADNHDVDRVASRLAEPAHLYPLYCLLMTMPGVPSVYYGSEWGIPGEKAGHSDRELRPALEPAQASARSPHPELAGAIARLARLRAGSVALRRGDYRQLHVGAELLVFQRRWGEELALVAVNAAGTPAEVEAAAPGRTPSFRDLLNPPQAVQARTGRLRFRVPPRWARVLAPTSG